MCNNLTHANQTNLDDLGAIHNTTYFIRVISTFAGNKPQRCYSRLFVVIKI